MATIKPTHKDPISPQSEKFEKDFKKTMIQTGAPAIHEAEDMLNEVDGMLSEAEQSLKKKIWSLAKMEALVFSDPKLSAVYEDMAENGEEKYGYHYNETIQNMIFNDYVLNSPKYLQKYKMAIPKEKKRRDKSGINKLKKVGAEKMAQTGLPKEKEVSEAEIEESTSAGSAGGAAGYVGYAGPAAFSSKGDLSGDFKGKNKKKKTDSKAKPISRAFALGESNYLTDPSGWEKYIEMLNEDILIEGSARSSSSNTNHHNGGAYESPVGFRDDVKNVSKELDTEAELKDLDTVRTVLPGKEKRAYGKTKPSGPNVSSAIATPIENKEVKKPYYPGGKVTSPFKTGSENVSGTILAKHSQPEKMNENMEIDEKAKSKSQQRFMGMVNAYKNGELDGEASPEIERAAQSMTDKEVDDFASTKHKGLPDHVDETMGQPDIEYLVKAYEIINSGPHYDPAKAEAFRANISQMDDAEAQQVYRRLEGMLRQMGYTNSQQVMDFQNNFNEEIDMKHFTLTVQHDNGEVKIKIIASDKNAAIQKVMSAENCPASAITDVVEEPMKEETQTMIQNNGTSMSNSAQPVGDQSSDTPMGMQQTGGLSEISTGLAQSAGQAALQQQSQMTQHDPIGADKKLHQYDKMIGYVNPEIQALLKNTGFEAQGIDGGIRIHNHEEGDAYVAIDVSPKRYSFSKGENYFMQQIDEPTKRKINTVIKKAQVDLGGGPPAAMNEDLALLEEINKELEAFSIHHNKLKLMAEDRKTTSQILNKRVNDENPKNFKKDLQHSGVKQVIDVEKELEWKDQQTDVGDPQKLGADIEKNEIKVADMKSHEALKNVGNSTNNDGDEVPKRNLTTKEQEEVDLYRNGQHSLNYDNEPDPRFVDRMEADQGEFFEMGEKQKEFKKDAPMFNKDTQPIEDAEVEKVQFDKNVKRKGDEVAWNERMGLGSNVKLKESFISGRYTNAIGESHIIDFKMNEVSGEINEEASQSLFPLNFTGLGNKYESKTVDKKVVVNEAVVAVMESHKFFTNGKDIFAMKNKVQKLNESDERKMEMPVINEEQEKMMHLLGYKPEAYVSTKGVKQNRNF